MTGWYDHRSKTGVREPGAKECLHLAQGNGEERTGPCGLQKDPALLALCCPVRFTLENVGE